MATRNIAQGDLIFQEPPLTAGAFQAVHQPDNKRPVFPKKGLGSTQLQCVLGVTDLPRWWDPGLLIKSGSNTQFLLSADAPSVSGQCAGPSARRGRSTGLSVRLGSDCWQITSHPDQEQFICKANCHEKYCIQVSFQDEMNATLANRCFLQRGSDPPN